MSCPDCGCTDVRYFRLLGGALEEICAWCEGTLCIVEVDYEVA